MCSLSVNTKYFAAFILIYLAAVHFVHCFNPKSVHWTAHGSERLSELSEYEIVTPVRLDEHTGQPLGPDSPTRHFRKRSASPPPRRSRDGNEDDEDEPQATFLLGAFHRQFQLNLSRDNSFFSPSFVVEFLGGEEDDSDVEDLDANAPLHCFYKGVVNGEASSSAVFSLCDGMHGLFQTPEGTQYFVEPLDDSTSAEEGSSRPHVVYPTTALQDLNKNSGCGLTDEDFASKVPLSNSSNDVPGPHGSHPHKHRHGKRRRLHSQEEGGPTNTLAAQLYQMHQRISKSIKQQDSNNNNKDNSTTEPDSSSDTLTHHRDKRFISYTRHVELMVVADSKMLHHHGANLEHYLLTLVALVNKIFKDPSIGNDVNIVLVKLLVLRREEENLPITTDAPKTLRNFCIWQREQNQKQDTHPHHFDTAVLITKEDICRSTFDCDTLGLAELGTMCDPNSSCSIVQDNGLSAAFTMAHELGHVFNLPHDDNTKCRGMEDPSGKYGVMAPTLNYQINPWTWSRCSQTQITEYLDMGYGQCLLDSPSDAQILPRYQPGEVYNVSRQCELVFGEGTSVCPIMRTCNRLWCTGSSHGSQLGCRTQHMPWADGTPCGYNMWCDRGKCIRRQHNVIPIDGGWGKWQPYGDCSRTCGGGVKQAIRQCTQPVPSNGGKYCIGRRVRFRSCNARTCPVNAIPFREKQCADFNNNNFNIHDVPRDVRWIAKYDGVQPKDRCSLICQVEGSIAYYKLAKKVIDGTLCGKDTDDICVQGQCWRAGCDHILGSQTQRDNCGICGGDNQACTTVTGTYNKTQYGYNKVVDIPAGATKIDIRQHSYPGAPKDDNYLAIQSSTGEYLLNGHFVVSQFQREIKIGSIILEYSGSNNSIEKITCHEKIISGITIFVLSVGKVLPPDIRYSYNIPIDNKVIYIWDMYGLWDDCSKICRGEKVRRPRCLRQSDRIQVKDERCRGRRPEAVTAKCNTGCNVRWEVTAESDCSSTSTCGIGRRTRRVQCVKTVGRRRYSVVVAESHCRDQNRPAEVIECGTECQQSHWEYSAWTQCSRSCDSGTRRRSASCRDANGYYAQDSNCDSSNKHIVERCNTQQCPIWAAQSWSECSVTCGDGEMQRSVRCYQGNQEVDRSECDPGSRPETRKLCQMEECAIWHQGEWGPCSSSCGLGSMQRLVSCMTGNQPSEPTRCDPSLMPDTTRSCDNAECPFWHQGEWSLCSVTCGEGERQRLVSCYQGNYVVDSSRCDRRSMPESSVSCNMGECTNWQEGSWGPCSVTCGQGERQRRVSCYQGNQEVDVSYCNDQHKPEETTSCRLSECAVWEHREWEQCSVSCGQGTQQRDVSCVRDNQLVHETECDPSLLPESTRPCQMVECAVWSYGEWSPCSGSCGQGEMQRYVTCYQGNREVSTSQCDADRRPDDVASCDMPECPVWHQGEWGPCSTSCDEGEKHRVVACYQGNREVDLSQCDLTLMPESVTSCEVTQCAYWNHGEWGPCSGSCGQGEMQRYVTCYQGNREVSTSQCDADRRPDDVASCDMPECPVWHQRDWGPCSTSCDEGEKHRVVACYQGNREVDLSQCDLTLMPESVTSCEVTQCAYWQHGEWGPCSTTCDEGKKRRSVNCFRGNDIVVDSQCDSSKKPVKVTPCQVVECPVWKDGDWGQCSVTCGQGIRKRRPVCYQGNQEIDMSQCDLTLMPETTRVCEMADCTGWYIGEWEPCSVSCGHGEMQRRVSCSQNGRNVDINRCDRSLMPETVKGCDMPGCASWHASQWAQCSVTCGQGKMLRKVNCFQGNHNVDNDQCDLTIMPAISKSCDLGKCPVWRHGHWGPCSVTCGLGYQLRGIQCRHVNDTPLPDAHCNQDGKPLKQQECHMPTCPLPTEPVIEPTPTHAPVKPTRTIPKSTQMAPVPAFLRRPSALTPRQSPRPSSPSSSSQRSSLTDTSPSVSHEPSYSQPAPPQSSPPHSSPPRSSPPQSSPIASMEVLREQPRRRYSSQWRTGKWTECSATCGYGTRERYVSCRDRYGYISEERDCDTSNRPPAIEQCQLKPCPHWRTGQWNRCSVTCGHGTTSRYVACVNGDSSIAEDEECDLRDRPKDKDSCSHQECPTDQLVSSGMASERGVVLSRGRWRTGQWSKCSSTCGSGLRQRMVICQDDSGDVETCTEASRPQNIEACNTGVPCPLWSFGEWGQCSASCGGGIKSRLVLCRLRSGRTLPDTSCNILSRPEKTRICSSNPCPSRSTWRTSPWGRCSVTCGTGTQQRTVSCEDETGVEIPSTECDLVEEAKPSAQKECQEVECPRPTWRLGNWTSCSVTCGTGTQQRTVTCQDGDEREDVECEEDGVSKPAMQKECQQIECPRPKWTLGDWTPCSVTCGTGTQQRTVTCQDETGVEIPSTECDLTDEAKPSVHRECQEVDCPRPTWRLGNWTSCSVTCGTGTQQRTVSCEDETGVEIPSTECELIEEAEPSAHRECQQTECPRPKWTLGDWTSCSVTCGTGTQQRTVSCEDETGVEIPGTECELPEEAEPSAHRECQLGECPRPTWTLGDWSPCSMTCGNGSQQRTVSCVDESGDERPEQECQSEGDWVQKPVMLKKCYLGECNRPKWRVGNWTQCSATCGSGSQQRTVHCVGVSEEERPDHECEEGEGGSTRPAAETECQLEACPRSKWSVGNWSQCSVTCGLGTQERTVGCVNETGEERPDSECEEVKEKPSTQKECRQVGCPRPKWVAADWSECSVTCDKGIRIRDVSCQMKGLVVDDSLCLRKKPKASKKCSRDKCKKYRWMKGRWSPCSKTCNGGRKHRKVHCTDAKGNEMDNSLCATKRRPRDYTKCNTHKCDTPRMTWLAGPWGECTEPCGAGTQTRSITCQAHSPDGWAMPTDDDACHQDSRPQDTRQCFIRLCSSDTHWMMGPWSQCSKECGGGIKERKVQCRDLLGKRLPRSSCGPPTIRPETREICNYQPCHPQSCRDIQTQYNLHEDKEYSILVKGAALTVYCHDMTTDNPMEYITLSVGEAENFAEIYPKRLLRPTQCPYHGNRNEACECTDEGHPDAGLTTFKKLRLNITNMQINIMDPTFADVRYGKFIPYATAGDCYSSAQCPQGRFHINLTGTRLAVASGVDWATNGYAVTKRLSKDELNQRVAGRCGGFCGTCFPDTRRGGLQVTFIS